MAAALALPATAVAAPTTTNPEPDGRAGRAESPAGVAAVIAGFGVGLNRDSRVSAGPYNPVAAKVDYGTAINTFGGGGMRTHEGQDMFAPEGTPEVSPEATVVLETGTDGGRGNWAALYEPKSERTFVYMHMLEPAAVKAGERLGAGDRVGLLGCTGSCDGAHLHFEIREGKDPYGEPVDPLPELRRWARYTGD